jgi:flagellar protein FliO/FliZ
MNTLPIKLLFLAILLPCAFGQAVPSSSRAENGTLIGAGVAADRMQTTPTTEMQDGGMHFPVLRTLGGMGLVLCLIAGLYFAARKVAPRYFAKATAERNLKVVETISMGDRRSISVIEIGGRRFLVGNTPQQINVLATLPESPSLGSEPEALAENPKEKGLRELASPFRNLFETEKKRKPQSMAHGLPEDVRAKMRQLRESLER